MTTKQLSRRQSCWSKYQSRFNFVIQFWPDKLGAKPDVLTRRSKDLFKAWDNYIKQMTQIVLKQHNFNPAIAIKTDIEADIYLDIYLSPTLPMPATLNFNSTTLNISADASFNTEEEVESLDQLLNQGYEDDLIPGRVLKLLAQGANYSKNLTIADCSNVNRRLYY